MTIISPMICASMPRNSGTRESIPNVTTKSRRWIELTKPVATIPTGSANRPRPTIMVRPAMKRPRAVTGVTSP